MSNKGTALAAELGRGSPIEMSAMQPTTQPANGVTPARGAAQARSAPEGAVVGKPTAARRTARKSNRGFSLANFLANAGLGKVIVEESPDAHIFSQGDAADAVFYIQKGRVKLSVVSKQGKEAVIALLGPGEFVGEACIASGHPVRLTTATALSECVLLKISRKEMARVLGREHALSDVFVYFLLARNARIQADVVDQLFSSSEKRLARVLLLLAQFGKEGKPETIVPKLSQETLAEMVGTTRSRVSFFMNRFRKMGFIEYKGEMRIHSSLLNVVLHD